MKGLTKTQINALQLLWQQPVTDICRLIYVSRTRKTMESLCNKGLAQWHPYASGGEGAWKITPEGKNAWKEIANANKNY